VPELTDDQAAKELRLHVLRYMECAARLLKRDGADALRAEMKSIREATGRSHAELLALGTDTLLDDCR